MFEQDPSVRFQARAKALDHAMGQSDFDLAECRRYMRLAFAHDDGDAYARLLGRLDQWGELGDAQASALAGEAFFGLRPAILGRIAGMRPESVAGERADGVDFCRGGLALAVAKGDKLATFALAKAMLSLPRGDDRLRGALAEAIELASSPIEASWRSSTPEETERQLDAARALVAECERIHIGAGVVDPGQSGKRGALAL